MCFRHSGECFCRRESASLLMKNCCTKPVLLSKSMVATGSQTPACCSSPQIRKECCQLPIRHRRTPKAEFSEGSLRAGWKACSPVPSSCYPLAVWAKSYERRAHHEH